MILNVALKLLTSRDSFTMVSNSQKPFPVTRYVPYDYFCDWYYPYGNTRAEDLLENVRNLKDTPSVLLLGCGDIRSCFYTLWKRFDHLTDESELKGVHFFVNDRSPAVIARNILFIHLLCKNVPENQLEWIPALWAIWYCFELLPDHVAVLKNALSELLLLSTKWSTSREHTCTMCSIDEETLQDVTKIWKYWDTINFDQDLEKKKKNEREKLLKEKHETFGGIEEGYEERSEYLNNGSAYAEAVISGPIDTTVIRAINPTFFENKEMYNLHYSLMPYNVFFYDYKENVEVFKQSNVIVNSEHSKTKPILANCIKQFTLWISAAQKCLNLDKVKFTFNSLNEAELCLKWLHGDKFDVIYSSNILDYLSPLVLVLAAVPLLKEGAVLITTSMNHTKNFASIDKYLTAMFGFELKLLPIIFGIRCIGHEDEYSDVTTTCPFSLVVKQNPYQMIWEKCCSFPLKIMSLSESPEITKGLYSLTKLALRPDRKLTTKESKSTYTASMCTETAIQAYLVFVSNLHPDVSVDTFDFWESLCQELKNDDELKHYMLYIQTHAQLHGLHLHLSPSYKLDCAICNRSNVHILQFVVEVNVPKQYSISSTPYFMGELKINNELVSIIDSVACEKMSDKIELSLFLPSSITDLKYSIHVNVHPGECFNCSTMESQFKPSPNHTYIFSKASKKPCDSTSSVGKIISHVGFGDHFLTKISTGPALKMTSHNSLQLSTGTEKFTLVYPYSICEPSLTKTENINIITVKRSCSHFYDEKPLFIVDITNPLCFQYSRPAGVQYYLYQSSNACESETMTSVKLIIKTFYETSSTYLDFVFDGQVLGIIEIKKKIYDLEKLSPAVYIYFCFSPPHSQQYLESIQQRVSIKQIEISLHVFGVLTKILRYFAHRTFKGTTHYNLQENFIPAVVYPLYLQNFLKCAGCGKNTHRMCSCHKVAYCNSTCQKKDWPTHKEEHR